MNKIIRFILKTALFFIGLLLVYVIMGKELCWSDLFFMALGAACVETILRYLEGI
ncbi:hypothetical protein [Xylanibacter caecicola]|uniref:hypothetical protein n=1 Tax=Xylanibacter caecicola TaxID=2736294 RepID=UPI00258A141C|nr:hypothetical protein [Xylanibacter caecicola]